MPRLGDSFSSRDRRSYAKRCLKPGTVFRIFTPFTKPPKIKYVILAAMADSPLLILINTDMPRFALKRPKIEQAQVKLDATVHSFLEHDSFADCSRIFDKMSEDDFVKQIVDDTDCVRGELPQVTRRQIVEAVSRATTVSKSQKKLISQALG